MYIRFRNIPCIVTEDGYVIDSVRDWVVYLQEHRGVRIPLIPASHSAVVPATCSGHPGHFRKHSEAGRFYLTCADRSASI